MDPSLRASDEEYVGFLEELWDAGMQGSWSPGDPVTVWATCSLLPGEKNAFFSFARLAGSAPVRLNPPGLLKHHASPTSGGSAVRSIAAVASSSIAAIGAAQQGIGEGLPQAPAGKKSAAAPERPPSHHHRPTLYHLQLTHTVPSSSPVRGIRARVGTLSGRRRLAGTAAARAPRARHARRASLFV